MKSRPLVVGMFDDDRNLDRAVERLAAEGFEDSVFDQATVSEGPGNSGPTPSARYLSPEPFPFKLLGNGIFLEPLAPLDRDSQTTICQKRRSRLTPGSSSATRNLFWSHQNPSERPGRWKSSASAKHRGSISMSGFVSLSNS
jgi:hypothetical protein